MKLLQVALLLLFATILCFAGARPAHAQVPPLAEYHIRAFGPAPGGLLSGSVRGLAQIDGGYIYIAQARGLARYDGYGFQRVALPGLRSEWIEKLYVDRQSR